MNFNWFESFWFIFIVGLVFVLILLFFNSFWFGNDGSSTYPNVLLIHSDAVRPDHMSVYGYERDTTPFLRNFSSNCVVYNNAYTTWVQTSQSVASMMTSTFSDSTGVKSIRSVLPESRLTLAEVLWMKGYNTAGFVGNLNLAEEYHFNQGFVDYETHWGAGTNLTQAGKDDVFGCEGIRDKAVKWIGSQSKHTPFFVWLFFVDTHAPYIPPEPYASMYGGDNISLYDGEVRRVDDCVKAVVGELEVKGLLNDTLIVFMSDHGESLGEGGLWGHGSDLVVEQARIPLLFCGKYVIPRRVGLNVSSLDVAPSILRYVGLEEPKEFLGVSFYPVAFEHEVLVEESVDYANGTSVSGRVDEQLKMLGYLK